VWRSIQMISPPEAISEAAAIEGKLKVVWPLASGVRPHILSDRPAPSYPGRIGPPKGPPEGEACAPIAPFGSAALSATRPERAAYGLPTRDRDALSPYGTKPRGAPSGAPAGKDAPGGSRSARFYRVSDIANAR